MMQSGFFESADQRQAPVAAEKQRRAMRLRTSPVAGARAILMRMILGRTSLCPINIQRSPETVNETPVHICRRDAPALLRA
jgi:hypothetical protein